MSCPLFCTCHSMRKDWAATPSFPTPSSFLLSFGPYANDKRSTGREGFPLQDPLVRSMGWSQGRRGFTPTRDRVSQTGASAFFLRRKAFMMRLIIRRDRDTAGQGFLTLFIFGLHIHRQRSSLLRSCLKPFYMHLTKVNLLSLIPRRREENHYLLNFKEC